MSHDNHDDHDDDITIEDGVARIPIPSDILVGMTEHRQAFVERFGREPAMGDPLFWDPEVPPEQGPVQMDEQQVTDTIASAMMATGVDPAYIHAFRVTGLLPTGANQHLMDPDDIDAFSAAVAAYEAAYPPGQA